MSQNKSDNITSIGKRMSDATIFLHEAIARNAGLTGVDHKYLNIILSRNRLTAGELAAITGLTTGAVTGLIDRLEKKKFIKRVFDETDRRKIVLVPNRTQVDKVFTAVHRETQNQIEKLLAKFTSSELVTIEKYLSGAIDVMEHVTAQINRK